jgi:hypothetical protein
MLFLSGLRSYCGEKKGLKRDMIKICGLRGTKHEDTGDLLQP